MGMFLVKTSPCCYAKHPDVLTDNIRVFFTLDFMAISSILKTYHQITEKYIVYIWKSKYHSYLLF